MNPSPSVLANNQSVPKETRDIYLPEAATLVEIKTMTTVDSYFKVKLDSGKPLGHRPGQFVEVSLPGIGEAPISISSSPTRLDGLFDMVIRKVGTLTQSLHHLKPGAKLYIRGPFGTEFPMDDPLKGKDVLFIGGGIGLVPLRSAIQYALDQRDKYRSLTILFGARSPADRLFTDELKEWAARSDVRFLETVDRPAPGWSGSVGPITTLFSKLELDPAKTAALICGPPIMYKFVLKELRHAQIPNSGIYVSLERRMKCGVGKCGHCQINGFYVCQEGPVFTYKQLFDSTEALS